MIRILLISENKVHGFDVTDWETKHSDWYDNESVEYWYEDNGYDYEFVESDEDN